MNIKTIYKLFIIILTSLILSSCGFHLRGTTPLPQALQNAYIDNSTNNYSLSKNITSSLKSSGIHIAPDAQKASYIIFISSESISASQNSIDAIQQMREQNVSYSVSFSLKNKKGETIVQTKTLTANSTITLMPNELLTASSKLEQIKKTLEEDIANQLLLKLSSKSVLNKL